MLCCITKSDCAPKYLDVCTLSAQQTQGGSVVVGRKAKVAPPISLQDPKLPGLISRKHAALDLDENLQLVLTDLKSANGTYYTRKGDRTITRLEPDVPTVLEVGSTIYFGGKHEVHAEDGSFHPNPFVYLYITPAQPRGQHQVVDLKHQPPAALYGTGLV